MGETPEIHLPKLEKPQGKKQTATVVVGVLAIGWLAVELVFKPLFKKFNSKKGGSDDATASITAPIPPPDA